MCIIQLQNYVETKFDEYCDLTDGDRKKWIPNINLKSYFLKNIIMICLWFENVESTDKKDLTDKE